MVRGYADSEGIRSEASAHLGTRDICTIPGQGEVSKGSARPVRAMGTGGKVLEAQPAAGPLIGQPDG